MNQDQLRSLFDLSGRVAIVTGGTRGIGRSIAEGFVAAGARVAVASRKPDACAETEGALRAMGGAAIGVPTHLGELDALHDLVERTVGEFGRLDILVNNAATKAALLSFTRSMAAEFAPRGVRANALAPGSVDTDMMRKNTPEAQEQMANSSLQRRSAHPDEMVGPALFLASDAASFVTGQVVIADGGLVPH